MFAFGSKKPNSAASKHSAGIPTEKYNAGIPRFLLPGRDRDEYPDQRTADSGREQQPVISLHIRCRARLRDGTANAFDLAHDRIGSMYAWLPLLRATPSVRARYARRMLDSQLAATFARIALTNVATEYPYKLDQVLGSDADVRTPRTLHPAFAGSYDWHSCVHMHWTLARLLQTASESSHWRARPDEHFDARLTAANSAGRAGNSRAAAPRFLRASLRLGLVAEACR